MAAVATKKPGGEFAVQLTFPSVYESVYAAHPAPKQYAPQEPLQVVPPYAGDDFQAHYHEQKKRDADYYARQKVVSTRNAEIRALTSAHGYFGMPAPVLGQRKFANQSLGGYSSHSARQDGTSAPYQLVSNVGLEGGVLRTAEGQGYAKGRLQARIQQLNAIQAAKDAFVSGTTAPSEPGAAPTTTPAGAPVGETSKIELNLLLQTIIDDLMGASQALQAADRTDGLTRFTFGDGVRGLSLILRFVPTADAEEIEDVMGKVDIINNLLNGLTDPDRRDVPEIVSATAEERATTMKALFQKIREYMEKMSGAVNRSPKERVDLSKALVKTLGFSRFLKDLSAARVESTEVFRRVARGPMFDGADREELDDEDDDDDEDRFNRPATSREDDQQSRNLAEFDDDERQEFGAASGMWFGEAQVPRQGPAAFDGEEPEDLETRAILGPAARRRGPQRQPAEEFKVSEDGEIDYGRRAPFLRSKSLETQRTAATARSRRSGLASPQLEAMVRPLRSMIERQSTRDDITSRIDELEAEGDEGDEDEQVARQEAIEQLRAELGRLDAASARSVGQVRRPGFTSLGSYFDPDTQTFNVSTGREAPKQQRRLAQSSSAAAASAAYPLGYAPSWAGEERRVAVPRTPAAAAVLRSSTPATSRRASMATTRSGRVAPAPSRRVSIATTRSARAAPAPTGFQVPTRVDQLPDNRDALLDLMTRINEAQNRSGSNRLRVWASSDVDRIKAYLKEKLGLEGRPRGRPRK